MDTYKLISTTFPVEKTTNEILEEFTQAVNLCCHNGYKCLGGPQLSGTMLVQAMERDVDFIMYADDIHATRMQP